MPHASTAPTWRTAIEETIGMLVDCSVMASSPSISIWPSAVALPWLPIAGITNGSPPSARTSSPTERMIRAMVDMRAARAGVGHAALIVGPTGMPHNGGRHAKFRPFSIAAALAPGSGWRTPAERDSGGHIVKRQPVLVGDLLNGHPAR